MRRFFTIVSLVVLSPVAVLSTYLTGELTGTLSGTDYIVTGNIYVLPHDTLTIEPPVISDSDDILFAKTDPDGNVTITE